MTNTNDLAEAPEQVLEIAQAIIQGPEFEATFRGLGEAFAEQLALAALRGYQAALALRTPSDGPRPLDLREMDADDEAIEWVSSNLHGLRHDSGTIEYTLASVVRAFQAGRATTPGKE